MENTLSLNNDLSPAEAAAAMRKLVASIRGPLSLGVWEGDITGKASGNTFGGQHISVFNDVTLVAPCGPQGDKESEAVAALLVMAFQYAERIAEELETLDGPY